MPINHAALLKIQADYETLQYATQLRLRESQEKEMCMLCLGSALLRLKHDFKLTWEQIAEKIEGIGDKSHAYRLARREKALSQRAYNLAISSINRLLENEGYEIIDFPSYPNNS